MIMEPVSSYGCAIIGGYVYRGTQFTALQGVYLYGDLCTGKILGLIKNPDNTWTSSLITSTGGSISSFGQDEQGELYLIDYGAGTVYHISAPTVTISGNVGVAGATLSYTDGVAKTAISDNLGNYSFQVANNWSGTVTPTKVCYIFNPLSLSYANLTSDQTAQNYTFTLDSSPGCVGVNVSIGGTGVGSYGVPTHGSKLVSYPGVNSGPVEVQSSGSVPIIASLRFIPGNLKSFSEMMGYPANQLTSDYLFPWYTNNVNFASQVRFDNVGTTSTTVDVYVAGVLQGAYPLSAGQGLRESYTGVNNGPLEVKTTDGTPIIASLRVIFGSSSSSSEMMGYPASQLTSDYLFPWYTNNVNFASQVRFDNVGTTSTTVDVYVAGVLQRAYPLSAGQGLRESYAGVNNGPLEVKSTDGTPIIASLRVIFGSSSSSSEMMGYPASQLTSDYLFPWYTNNVNFASQVRFDNVGTTSTTVDVYVAGVLQGAYPLSAGQGLRESYTGVNNGPLEVKTTDGTPIIASLRVIFGSSSSSSEMMGYPASQLTSDYLFSWYTNNAGLSSQLRFVVP